MPIGRIGIFSEFVLICLSLIRFLKYIKFVWVTIPWSVSPFLAEDVASLKCITVPPSLCIAAANEQDVLVLTSKKSEAITFPWNQMGIIRSLEVVKCRFCKMNITVIEYSQNS